MAQPASKSGKAPFTVLIAEKPSVARDIGNFLIKHRKLSGRLESDKSGHGYWLPSGEFITYTVGHLTEFEMPDVYLTPAQQKSDPMTYLPLAIKEYKSHPRFERNKDGTYKMRDGHPVIDPLYKTVEKMLQKADIIINCGDIGREGQLIMDELFVQCGLDPRASHIKRVKIADLSDKGIATGFDEMGQNGEPFWYNLGQAGLCRQEADWSVGMNGSRAYQSITRNRQVALGRVKTPVLALVSNRCIAIENFKAVKYFVPVVTLHDGVELRWKGRPGCEGTPGFDSEGRMISEAIAKAVVDRINAGAMGRVTDLKNTHVKTPPPKPFSLVTLQSEASRKLGCAVSDVTKAAQDLYEKHKMISYVGTESNFYPEALLADAREIMANLSPMFRKVMEGADSSKVPKSFNDAKIDEHHAIAPKENANIHANLTAIEKGVFEMISRRFAAQFYPDYEYDSFGLSMQFEQDNFEARSTVTTCVGWKNAEGTVDGESMGEDVDPDSGPSDTQIDNDRDEVVERG